jgi:Holliday junction DNA helicase RuvA
MIALLNGKLLTKTTQTIVVDVAGVGFEVFIPLSTFYALPELHDRVTLQIYTHIRTDILTLFGFHTALEKRLFLMLISVSGIGPKLGLNVLSGIGPQDLLQAMAGSDAARLQAIPGVGKKTAERIALELKDRASKALGDLDLTPDRLIEAEDKHMMEDAVSALTNLGYTPKAAKPAIEKARIKTGEMTLEALIREALKLLA